MLAKENRLRPRKDIDLVFKMGKNYRSGYLSLKYLSKKTQYIRFAVSIGVKASASSPKRNRIKRIITEHIRHKWLKSANKGDIIVYFNQKLSKDEINDEKNILKNLDLVFNKWLK